MNLDNKLTLIKLFLALWEQVLVAREQADENEYKLTKLMIVADTIQDIAESIHDITVYSLSQDIVDACRDACDGVPWKSTIPSEEEIRQALSSHS